MLTASGILQGMQYTPAVIAIVCSDKDRAAFIETCHANHDRQAIENYVYDVMVQEYNKGTNLDFPLKCSVTYGILTDNPEYSNLE